MHPSELRKLLFISSNEKANVLSTKSGLPMIVAVPDSGATAHVTLTLTLTLTSGGRKLMSRLRSKVTCQELFSQANGSMTECTGIGDMPVIARTDELNLVKAL